MEQIAFYIMEHAANAHWVIFGLLMLAGLNIPISEDILLLVSGMLALTMPFEQGLYLYFWVFLGCYLSAWEGYWIGRLVSKSATEGRWLSKYLSEERIERMGNFYNRYGFWTLLVGRFIPFGVRNCLFMTAGMGRMSFPSFIWRDGIACFISTAVLFYFAYCFGKNYEVLYEYFLLYERVVAAILFTLAAVTVVAIWYRRQWRSQRAEVAER